MSVAAVILAAGASTRLGEPKALARLCGVPVVDRMLEALRAAGLKDPLIVTGAHDHEIRSHLETASQSAPLEVCHNRSWARGRTGGVQLAVKERPGRDLLLWPADVPLVKASTLAALVEAFEHPGHGTPGQTAWCWLAPSFGGKGTTGYGHPVLVGSALAAHALSLAADAPLRDLRAHGAPVTHMPCDDPGVLEDLDTRGDLARLEARLRMDS